MIYSEPPLSPDDPFLRGPEIRRSVKHETETTAALESLRKRQRLQVIIMATAGFSAVAALITLAILAVLY